MLARRVVGSVTPVVSLDRALDRHTMRGNVGRESCGVVLRKVRAVREEDGKLLGFIRGCHGLSHLSIPVLTPMGVNSLLDSVGGLFPGGGVRCVCGMRGPRAALVLSHSRVRRMLVGLLGGTNRTYMRRVCPRIVVDARYSLRGRLFFLSIYSGNDNVLPRMLSGVFIPFFAAGPANDNVKLDLYGRVVGLRNKDVSTDDRVKGKDYFALGFLYYKWGGFWNWYFSLWFSGW